MNTSHMMRLRRKLYVTGAELRAEGVIEVGQVAGTNVLFVVTEARIVLFLADVLTGHHGSSVGAHAKRKRKRRPRQLTSAAGACSQGPALPDRAALPKGSA